LYIFDFKIYLEDGGDEMTNLKYSFGEGAREAEEALHAYFRGNNDQLNEVIARRRARKAGLFDLCNSEDNLIEE